MNDTPKLWTETSIADDTGLYAMPNRVHHWVTWGLPIYRSLIVGEANLQEKQAYGIFARFTDGSREAPGGADLTNDTIASLGDSLFETEPTCNFGLVGNAGDLNFAFIKNANGRLAGFRIGPISASFKEAFDTALSACSIVDMALTLTAKIPCVVDSLQIASQDSSIRCWQTLSPVPIFRCATLRAQLSGPLFPYISLLTEALHSNSPFYRFLCFFKIVDSLLGDGNRVIQALAKRVGAKVNPLTGVLPEDPFAALCPSDVGKKYTTLRDKFQGSYRNVIAHLDTRSVFREADPAARAEVGRAAMAMCFMADDLIAKAHEALQALASPQLDLQNIRFDKAFRP